jgi:hypothetical protein
MKMLVILIGKIDLPLAAPRVRFRAGGVRA